VGCGRVAPKWELMRLVALREGTGGQALAVCDPDGTMPGRGAYLCREQRTGGLEGDCLALARRRGAIGRALRCSVKVASEGLESVSR
jgi:predicted RNA-binding protein YlxR (DUF448 family)